MKARTAALTAAGMAAFLVAVLPSAGATEAQKQLPNLVALAPADLEIAEADPVEGERSAAPALRFAAGAANRGEYALELLGVPSGANTAVAQQCISWAVPRVCAGRADVGTFEWHPEHGHYHFQDFALYELRRLTRTGAVNLGKRGLIRTSGKVSYCVIDYEADDPERDVLYRQPYPLYYSCVAGGMQGISPGWRDVYGNSLAGQQIPLEGIPDGTYALLSYFDPANRLHETDETDNLALVYVTIRGDRVDVLCKQEPGDRTCVRVEDETV